MLLFGKRLCYRAALAGKRNDLKRYTFILGAVALVALVAVGGVRYGKTHRRAAGPNVLLITLDTLRRDRLGCYGSTVTRTPNIDRLANEGMVFDNAAAPMPATRASHATIFTSQYPRDHGVMNNRMPLDPRVPMLSEVFQRAGYRTGGFVSVRLLGPESGMTRGFDVLDWPEHVRSADETIPLALEWLKTGRFEEPFFLWVHLYDPHMPYEPPAKFIPDGDPMHASKLGAVSWQRLAKLARKTGGDLSQTTFEQVVSLYNGEVQYADHWLGALLDALRTRTALDHTIVAFTADHGECFDHGIFFEHFNCLYEGAMHVPLILRYPPKVAAGTRSNAVVEHLDIAPTLLTLAGLPVPETFRGTPYFSGRPAADRNAFIQYPRFRIEHLHALAKRTDMRTVMGQAVRPRLIVPPPVGIRNGDWKYIVSGSDEELYHLPSDPGETRNLAAERPEVVSRLRPLLNRWIASHPEPPENSTPISEAVKETLRSLGYPE